MVDSKYLVPLETPCVYYDSDFLSEEQANDYYRDLRENIKWEKTPKINRWVSLHEQQEDQNYKYRDAPGAAQVGFNQTISAIQQRAQEWYLEQTGIKVEFNVCLLNYYEDGQQRIGWHSDREEVGRTTPIASVSLGTVRQFFIRSKENGVQDRASLKLQNGSLVIMENITQSKYLHCVPKESDVTAGRINLTFRCKSQQDDTAGEQEHERRDDWLKKLIDGAEPNNSHGWSLENDGSTRRTIFGDGVQMDELDQDYSRIHFLVKTNIGAECYCAAEMQEVLQDNGFQDEWRIVAKPLGIDGFVACCCCCNDVPPETIAKTASLFLRLRSALHVLEYHCHFDLNDCTTEQLPEPKIVDGDTLYQYFKKQLVEGRAKVTSLERLDKGGTFRVTCDRVGGPHAFRAPDVEFEMGGAMAEHYTHLKPKMEDYDVCVRVDVVGYLVVIGTQLNVYDLSKERHFVKFRNSVTIKNNLAYAMVRLAAIQPGNVVVDPFCGSGTLLLEALETYNKKLYCVGMDVSRRSADGARENALAEGYKSDVCKFVCSDARALRRHLEDDSVNAIITNLPWGVMVGHKNVSDLATMYEIFLRTSWYCLKPGARIVMLVLRGLQLVRIVRKLSGRYRLLSVNVVRTTNNLPCIVVVEKLAADELRDCVKGQLAHLNQYVNFRPEMYQAIHMEDIEEDT